MKKKIINYVRLFFRLLPLSPHLKCRAQIVAFRILGPLGAFGGSEDYWRWKCAEAVPQQVMTLSREGRRGKTLLIIDHDLPMPDQDAGSRVMRCFVDLFLTAGFDVKFWSDRVWPEQRYIDALRQSGVEVFYGGDYVGRLDDWLEKTPVDYVLLSRPLVARVYISTIRRYSKAKILYYGHDIHFMRMAAEAALKKSLVASLMSRVMRHIELQLWKSADVVYYPSASEANAVIALMSGVVARAVPLFFYEGSSFPDYSQDGLAKKSGLIFVGGFKHAPNIDAVRWFVADILPLIKAKRPDVILTVVGSNPVSEVMDLASDSVRVVGYLSDNELRNAYADSRVAVVPLRFGAGVKGKVIEAMHFGVPVVTTSTGLQGLSALEDFMPPADSAVDFANQVLELMADDGLWRDRGYAALNHVEENFSLSAMRKILAVDVEALER